MFYEGQFGKPYKRDPKVVEALKAQGMIQTQDPTPWRKSEVKALSRMFGLPE
jgi:hypothetical protein